MSNKTLAERMENACKYTKQALMELDALYTGQGSQQEILDVYIILLEVQKRLVYLKKTAKNNAYPGGDYVPVVTNY